MSREISTQRKSFFNLMLIVVVLALVLLLPGSANAEMVDNLSNAGCVSCHTDYPGTKSSSGTVYKHKITNCTSCHYGGHTNATGPPIDRMWNCRYCHLTTFTDLYTWPSGSWDGSVSGFKSYVDPLRGAVLGTKSVWMAAHFGGAGLTATSQPTDFPVDANFTYHNNSQSFQHTSGFSDATCANCHKATLTSEHEGKSKVNNNPAENFEDGDFAFNFTGEWGGDWSRVSETVYAGTYSFKSVLIGKGISGPAPVAVTQTTVNVGTNGTVSFWYRVNNGAYPLYFYIDDTQMLVGTSTVWVNAVYPMTPGSHTLKWRTGGNSAYIDDVSVLGGSTSYTIDCNTCHLSSDTAVKTAIASHNTTCSSCHGAVDHETPHNGSLNSSCQTCHLASLTLEHTNNPNTTGVNNYTCDTCHANTDAQVQRAIVAGNLSCAGCHNKLTTHKVTITDKVPVDIPLYEGFSWSTPAEALLFAGAPNFPAGYEQGRVVFSKRRTDVTSLQISNYYQSQMAAAGWSVVPDVPPLTTSAFIQFTKQNRMVFLRVFNTENVDGSGEQDLGYRIELWYK